MYFSICYSSGVYADIDICHTNALQLFNDKNVAILLWQLYSNERIYQKKEN